MVIRAVAFRMGQVRVEISEIVGDDVRGDDLVAVINKVWRSAREVAGSVCGAQPDVEVLHAPDDCSLGHSSR